MPHLFDPLTIRGVTFPNRVFVSPMCEYSSVDGFANDWHLVHLGSRAVGGAGLVLTEATAVPPEGRISPQDLGIWSDDHVEPLARIVRLHPRRRAASPACSWRTPAARRARSARGRGTGAFPRTRAAGRRSSRRARCRLPTTTRCRRRSRSTAFASVVDGFATAARRALAAGFRVIEIHAAHGYLIHEFLSPLSNERTDDYGGSFENRTRLLREVVAAVRDVWPERLAALRAHLGDRLGRRRVGCSSSRSSSRAS